MDPFLKPCTWYMVLTMPIWSRRPWNHFRKWVLHSGNQTTLDKGMTRTWSDGAGRTQCMEAL